MQAVSDPRATLRREPAHSPVEYATTDGKTMIRCAGARCASWNPRPFPSRREAEFWYDRHVRQPLTHQLW